MTLSELQQWVASGESAQVEFKASTGQRSDAAKTACGMLNGRGGIILFGVTPSGEIKGQQLGSATLEDVAAEFRKLDPPSSLDIETVPLSSGACIIAVRVPGGGGPYTYDGRPYSRQGPTTSLMARTMYERLLLERMHSSARWENRPAEGIALADLDSAEIVRTIDEAIRRGRMDDPGTRDPAQLLQGLQLINDAGVLNAAVALFCKADRLLPLYPQCILRMARFRGVRVTDDFLDNRQEYGNIFELLQRGQRFFRDHLPVAGRIVPGLYERIDDPLYPPTALREALANALCHRDYSSGSGAVSIGIYDDRLEITSSGSLHFGLSADDLLRPHLSHPWNPLIAQTMYRRAIIETWGRGTLKIAELLEVAGLEPPEFETRRDEVIVRFRPTRYVPPSRIGHDLSPLQRELLQLLADQGPTAIGQICEKLQNDAPRRTIQFNLDLLRSLDLVELAGEGRGARWSLKGSVS